jgi:pimeloyl-ACP methyl ester carboxylesterase
MPATPHVRRALLSAAFGLALIATQAQAALPAGVSCQLTPTPPKTAAQKATERLTWGQWASFDEADVQLNGLTAPEPSARYHLLMKRPGAQPATERPLLVFLHGFPEFSWAWETWLQRFGSQYDSIAIDLKGYANSSRPADVAAYDITRLAHELDHVVDCLGYRKVIPIAHDWGASLAWTYAFAHPERLQAMVIMATPHPYTFGRELAQPGSEQRQRSQYIVDVRSGKVKDLLSLSVATGPGGTALLTLPFYKGARLNRLLGAVFTPNARLNAELNYYRAIAWPTVEAFPAQPTAESLKTYGVQAPTLAFWGTADGYFSPRSWDGIQAFVPNIELRAVDGADHWLDHNRPELPDQVMDFLRRVAP